MKVEAFTADGPTVNLTGGTTTSNIQVVGNPYSHHVRIYNSGTVVVFIQIGGSAVTATVASSIPLAPGNVEIFGFGQTYIAAITASGSAVIYCTPGCGL